MAKHVDPICGMQVEEERAAGEAVYAGSRYYFCSGGCRERFNEDPGRYATRAEPEGEKNKVR